MQQYLRELASFKGHLHVIEIAPAPQGSRVCLSGQGGDVNLGLRLGNAPLTGAGFHGGHRSPTHAEISLPALSVGTEPMGMEKAGGQPCFGLKQCNV